MLSHLKWMLTSVIIGLIAPALAAQSADDYYVRIEARSSLSAAEGQLRTYAASGLDNLNGFRLGSVWYGMALGPYADEQSALAALRQLRAAGQIPSDSFVTTRGEMGERYWPAGAAEAASATDEEDASEETESTASASGSQEGDLGAALIGAIGDQSGASEEATEEAVEAAAAEAEEVADEAEAVEASAPSTSEAEPEAAVEAEPEPEPEPVETRAQMLERARAAEAALSRDDKRVLQSRLQWAGFYNSTIDGLFGRGTRGAITAWQEDRGLEPLGVMLPEHMEQLEREFFAVFEGLGMEAVSHATAGVTLDLPMAILGEATVEPPFVIYEPAGEPEATVVLISQAGGRERLGGLYQALQSLDLIPLEGERSIEGDRFVINGNATDRIAYVEAETEDNEIKGFVLVWPTGDEERRTRLIERMQDSFVRQPGVLGERAAVAWSGREALLSGLAVRQPAMTGSGSYVTSDGRVLTTSTLTESCSRLTLGKDHDMRVVAQNEAGLALLASDDGPLAPLGVLGLGEAVTAPADIAVSGYSYGGRLNAPTVTFGELNEVGGLNGEEGLIRLSVGASNNDTGGPVLSRDGRFAGVLLPSNSDEERLLPDQVRFAADRDSVVAFLAENGVTLNDASPATEDLVGLRDYAQKVTAQISCWE